MLKLYRCRDDGKFEYHEAWINGDEVTSHWGVIGERGQTETYLKPNEAASDDDVLMEVLRDPVEQGFRPLDGGSWHQLIIEYELESWGDGSDLDKRHRLESRMNETLGWLGLGHCDGGSIGSGTMEVCCIVADFAIAKQAIESDLKSTDFADYSRIYDESE